MSKIKEYVRHLAVVAMATLAAQCAWAVDGLNYTWRSGWDADPAQTVSYSNYTGENGILFAGQQMGIVAQVKLVSNVSANIINFGGDNRVVLATDADGKYTLSSNIAALNGHTSETAAMTGWHRYSMFVRRGVNGSGHAASVIVYEDGNVIFKITDGSFVTGPFRNLTIGGKQGNLAKGGHWSAHLSAGAATADETTAAAVEADCVKMYPPVDETIVAKIGETGYQTLEAAMTYATEHATAEAPIAVKLLALHTGDVAIPENVTIEMTTDNRIAGAISGAGTVKLSHSSTATQGSLATWIGEGKMTFGEFTGTVHLAAGRFNATSALVPATAKVKVTSGAQLFLDGGTWTNTIEIEGAGYGSETGAIGRAALRFENGNIDGATIVTTGTGDNAPAIGSHNSDRTFACAISGSGDLRLVLGTGAHTYTLNNNTFTGALTIVDANLTVKGTFTNNAIKGAGTYSIALANANSSARINTLFTAGQLADFSGKLLMTQGRFEFASGNETLIPSAVTLATSNQGKIYLGSGTWNNHFVIAGNGWTGDGSYKMGPVALRVDNATFGENASIQAVVESNVVPAIGVYNTNPTLCAITGNGGLRIRSHNAQTITISAANLSGLSGTINLVDANATLEITAAEEATVANDISGSGKIKKSGEGALTLSGNVSCAVKLAAGTIVSETVTGEVTTDVACKHVAFDEATNTYSLEEDVTEITFTVTGLPEHAVAYIQINNGETTPIEGGMFTAMPGDQFVVWFTPAEGYVGKTLSTGVVTVVYPMQTTEIQSPTAELMNIRPVVAIAAVGEPSMQPEIQGFGSLAEAIAAGWFVFLTDAVTVDSTIVIDHSVVIDLQGHNVTGNGVRVFQVKNGTVEIDSTDADSGDVIPATVSTIGSINPDSSVIRIGGGDASAAPELTIDEGVTVTSAISYGITAFGVGTQTLVVDGTVSTTGNRPAISGNGNASNGETTITINGTVSATAENAIYQPQAGTTTINGTVTGGIEAKAGTVTIKTGATVSAREATATHTANGDGCSTQGYAIAVVDNAGYKGGAVVTIEGGTITGPVAQVVDSEAKEANTLTITGGTFTVDPSAYIADGYEATESEGVWTVSEKTGPTSWDDIKENDDVTTIITLPEGQTETAITATELKAWAEKTGATFGEAIPVNALIFNVTPAAAPTAETEAAAASKVLEEVIEAEELDLAALLEKAVNAGADGLTITSLEEEYPMATIKLVPSTKLDSTETAKFFQLSIELK